MLRESVLSISALLSATALLLLGGGLYGTLLAIRAGLEGFGTGTIGLVMAAYYAGFLVGCVLCMKLIRHVGHIRCYAALTAIISAASLGHVLVVDPVIWALLRCAAGFCFAGLYMVIESWLNEKAAHEIRGRVFAIYMMVNLGAIGLGQLLLLTAHANSFVLFCAVSMLISLAAVPVSLTRVTAPVPTQVMPLRLRELWRISPLGLLGCLAVGVGQGSFWSLTPSFARDAGYTNDGVAILMTIAVFGGLLLQWPIGWLSDRVDRRAVICGVSLATAVGAAALTFTSARGWIDGGMLVMAVYGGLSFSVYSLAVAHANDHAGHDRIVGLSASLLLVYAGGATVGPLAAGWLMDRLDAGVLFAWIAAIYLLLGGFTVWRMTRRPPLPVDEQGAFVGLARAGPTAALLDPRSDDDAGPLASAVRRDDE